MRKIPLLALVLLSIASTGAFAGGVSVDQSKVLDRWTLRLGGFLTGLDTKLRLDSPSGGEGTTIDLEDDLGFSNSQSVPRIELRLILGKRHQINGGWYRTDRDSRTTLTEELEWGDEVFPIDIDVAAFYETDFINLGYTYWFYSSEKTAVGVTGGLIYATLSAGIGVDLPGQDLTVEEDLSTDVPLPQLGFSISTYLGKSFVFAGRLGYIAFDLDDWSGDVSSASAAIEHRTWKNFGFGLGYAHTNYDIDASAADFLGEFEYNDSGFEIYGRAAW
jgi:hypothetical protein